MPRAIWKGTISFGLVTIPVGLYSAVERAEQIHFRLLHAKDESPIDYKRVCEVEGVEVPWPEIVKGYEISKGEFVVMTDKDFARARTETTRTLAIRDFVPAQAIDFLYFDEPYYLAPEGKDAAKSYALLRDALAKAGRVGVGTVVMRQREHLAALEPMDATLVLTTLRFAHEIRKPSALDLPPVGRGWDKKEMTLPSSSSTRSPANGIPATIATPITRSSARSSSKKPPARPSHSPLPRSPPAC